MSNSYFCGLHGIRVRIDLEGSEAWGSHVCHAAAGANRCSSCLMSCKLEIHQVKTVPVARQFDREQGHCKVTPRSPCRKDCWVLEAG